MATVFDQRATTLVKRRRGLPFIDLIARAGIHSGPFVRRLRQLGRIKNWQN